MNQRDSTDIQELHAWVSGWVQGVGFRYFVVERALSLGLRGFTRNDSSGDVEVLAQGKQAALEKLLSSLRRGPSSAEVSDVRVQWGQPAEYYSGFHIRW